MDKILTGLKILVTRPEKQAESLCKLIENLDGTAVRFPVIEIKPSENQQATDKILNNISQYDIGIFISRNAVDWTIKLLGDKRSELNSLDLIAIGSSTTEALEKYKNKDFSPRQIITNTGTNSEALLDLKELNAKEINHKKIVIFRGEGGRELLATKLRERGAIIDYAEVYRRGCPEYDKRLVDEIWIPNAPDIVIVTSNNGLENLFSLLNNEQRRLLLNKQLLVMGERMLGLSTTYGFSLAPILAEENSDEGILNAIVKWAASKRAGEISE